MVVNSRRIIVVRCGTYFGEVLAVCNNVTLRTAPWYLLFRTDEFMAWFDALLSMILWDSA